MLEAEGEDLQLSEFGYKAMYRKPILIALLVFTAASVAEIISVSILHGSVFAWITTPERVPQVLVIVGFNALQGALLGYAAHRAAANKIELYRAKQERFRLAQELGPALSMVQYAAYSTADKRCIDICNDAICRAVMTLRSTL